MHASEVHVVVATDSPRYKQEKISSRGPLGRLEDWLGASSEEKSRVVVRNGQDDTNGRRRR